jgi:membrane protein implicated in regulation of membrane protease activity
MASRSPTKRHFLPSNRREWAAAGLLLVLGASAAVGVAAWARDDLRGAVLTATTLAIAALGTALRERAARRKWRTVAHALYRGRTAVVETGSGPTGRVRLDGTSWTAKSMDGQALQAGEQVYVHDGEGVVLYVSHQEPAA